MKQMVNKMLATWASLETIDQIAIAIFFILVIAVIGLNIYVSRAKKLTKAQKALNRQKKDKYFGSLYAVLARNRITRNYVRKLTKRFSIMSIYSKEQIQRGVAKYTRRLFYLTVIVTVAACFMFNDIVSVLICILMVYVYYSTSIELNIQKDVVKVYKELKLAIASIRLEYKKCYDVMLSLENASYGNLIAPVIQDLKTVMQSSNGEEALTRFYQKIPFKQVQTLAMICYNINNTGDKIDENGVSAFDEALLVMNSDVNQKIEEYDYEELKFGKIEMLALAGIATTLIIKVIMTNMLPSAAILYNSVIGLLIQYGCMLLSIYAYYKVAHGHIREIMQSDDRNEITYRLLKNKKFAKFVRIMGPKNQKKRILASKLHKSFSKKTVEDFVCDKMLYATIVFVFLLVAILISPYVQTSFVSNYVGAFDLSTSISYDNDDGVTIYTKQQILDMDKAYAELRDSGWPEKGAETELNTLDAYRAQIEAVSSSDSESDEEFSTEQIAIINAFIMEHMDNVAYAKEHNLTAEYAQTHNIVVNRKYTLTTMELQDQRQRLESKYQTLRSSSYKWYFVFIPIIGAFIAFKVPDRQLKKRIKIARNEEEEEFLQLQVVMMILASMNFDTLETLGHLAQIADIHKEMLLYCYYGYASDPVGELNRMQKQTQSENFKHFISKLKSTVEDLSIQEAFADLRADREHICNERAVYIKDAIDKKRKMLGQTALRPMQVAVYGMLVFPLVYTGLTGLMSAFNSISEL